MDAFISFDETSPFSFFKYLTESLTKFNRTIQLPLQDVKEEFPTLFNENVIDSPILY